MGDKLKVDHYINRFDSNIITGFQMACAAGPLCAEPIQGVAFVLEQFSHHEEQDAAGKYFFVNKENAGLLIFRHRDRWTNHHGRERLV